MMALNAPTKPLRSKFQQERLDKNQLNCDSVHTNKMSPSTGLVMDEYGKTYANNFYDLIATPKFHSTNESVQHPRFEENPKDINPDLKVTEYQMDNTNATDKMSDLWIRTPTENQKRKSGSYAFSNQNHWLIQEAEQRRLDQQRSVRSTNKKSLPDSVIQTITQRIQSMGIGDRKRCVFLIHYSL